MKRFTKFLFAFLSFLSLSFIFTKNAFAEGSLYEDVSNFAAQSFEKIAKENDVLVNTILRPLSIAPSNFDSEFGQSIKAVITPFTYGLIFFVIVFLIYNIITLLINGSLKGEFIKNNKGGLSATLIRILLGVIALIPVNGLTLAQYAVVWLAMQGVFLADNVYDKFVQRYNFDSAEIGYKTDPIKTEALLRELKPVVLSQACTILYNTAVGYDAVEELSGYSKMLSDDKGVGLKSLTKAVPFFSQPDKTNLVRSIPIVVAKYKDEKSNLVQRINVDVTLKNVKTKSFSGTKNDNIIKNLRDEGNDLKPYNEYIYSFGDPTGLTIAGVSQENLNAKFNTDNLITRSASKFCGSYRLTFDRYSNATNFIDKFSKMILPQGKDSLYYEFYTKVSGSTYAFFAKLNQNILNEVSIKQFERLFISPKENLLTVTNRDDNATIKSIAEKTIGLGDKLNLNLYHSVNDRDTSLRGTITNANQNSHIKTLFDISRILAQNAEYNAVRGNVAQYTNGRDNKISLNAVNGVDSNLTGLSQSMLSLIQEYANERASNDLINRAVGGALYGIGHQKNDRYKRLKEFITRYGFAGIGAWYWTIINDAAIFQEVNNPIPTIVVESSPFTELGSKTNSTSDSSFEFLDSKIKAFSSKMQYVSDYYDRMVDKITGRTSLDKSKIDSLNQIQDLVLSAMVGAANANANFIDSGHSNPVIQVYFMGSTLLSTVESIIQKAFNHEFSAVGTMIIFPIIFGLLAPAIMLTFMLPLQPFVIWISALLAWCVSLLEAIIAIPLWGLMHLLPERDGTVIGKQSVGYIKIFSLYLTPALMVFGFVGAVVLVKPLFEMLNSLYLIAARPLITSDGLTYIFSTIAIIIIYVMLLKAILTKVFQMIIDLPDRVVVWIGAIVGNMSSYANAIDSETKSTTSQVTAPISNAGSTLAYRGVGTAQSTVMGGGNTTSAAPQNGSVKKGFDEPLVKQFSPANIFSREEKKHHNKVGLTGNEVYKEMLDKRVNGLKDYHNMSESDKNTYRNEWGMMNANEKEEAIRRANPNVKFNKNTDFNISFENLDKMGLVGKAETINKNPTRKG